MEYKKFRFDFSQNVKLMLADFANMNKGLSRKEFTEAWLKWVGHTTIKTLLTSETNQMESDGFEGDVLDLMFKSVRYYHRKRQPEKNKSTTISSGKHQNRFSREFLKQMDDYILIQIDDLKNVDTVHGKEINTLSQSVAYTQYCEVNQNNILSEFRLIKQQRGKLSDMMADKLKKTYKNRFYACRK